MKKSMRISPLFTSLFVALGFFSLVSSVWAADKELPVVLLCRPEQATADLAGSFTETKGAEGAFLCEVSNKSTDRAFSLMLLGKQESDGTTTASSGSDVELPAGGSAEAKLVFPPLFQGGEYGYTFSAIDKQSKEVVSLPAYLMGSLKAEKQFMKLVSVVPEQEKVQWEESLTLLTMLDFSESWDFEKNPVTLRVAMKDMSGGECAILVEGQSVAAKEEKIALTLPKQGDCANGLMVSLHDAGGKVIDQKVVALGLATKSTPVREKSGFFSREDGTGMPTLLVGMLYATLFLVAALGGYVLLKKRKKHF